MASPVRTYVVSLLRIDQGDHLVPPGPPLPNNVQDDPTGIVNSRSCQCLQGTAAAETRALAPEVGAITSPP